jgi:hypothetical protein
MLIRKQKQLISYESITIYEKTYQLPILKNSKLKKVQKKIRECQILLKEGIKYHSYVWGIIKRKQEYSQEKTFIKVKSLIRDYTQIIDSMENYKDSYQEFLLKFTDDWKKLFNQKYFEIKKINDDRKNLEIKNQKNRAILEKLKLEKQENLKSILLLSNTNFLMLEKIQLLTEGIQNIAEDTKKQRQIIQQILKDLEGYQEIYEYQVRATKIRQEIAKIAETAINIELFLQDYFSPFQSLIDEVVQLDANFYAIVGELKNLADNSFNSPLSLFKSEETDIICQKTIELLVDSYEKKDRLRDAFNNFQLLDNQSYNFNLSEDVMTLDKVIELMSNYTFTQLVEQRKLLGIEENFISINSIPYSEKIELEEINNNNVNFDKKNKTIKNIDYIQLQNLLAQYQWKEADIETAKLMLKILGKNDWNEVYKEDINNFSCKDLHTIDRLWKQYSYGYFGFSIQQSIWNEIGGQIDYETEKRLGDRLGWRKEGIWLEYDQLTFNLSPTTPMGHLPVKWLHYSQDISDPSLNSSVDPLAVGTWRVGSWLVWQMHLFFSRVKNCNTDLNK